jgi:hypothetical protein
MDARVKAAAASGTTAAPLVPWSVHDLRRIVATGLQRLGVRLEVTEGVLNHISGSRGGIAGVTSATTGQSKSALDAWAQLAAVYSSAAGRGIVRLPAGDQRRGGDAAS